MRWLRIGLAAAVMAIVPAAHVAASAPATVPPTVPPTSVADAGPVASNDLLPERNDLGNCVGTLESANCGSKARADGHTYLVFLALVGGLAFIGWRIARGVRARDTAGSPAP